tara:strand:- start:536 stop:982 length:447 start_codon:yes stop_codon:yes gene_type:complete
MKSDRLLIWTESRYGCIDYQLAGPYSVATKKILNPLECDYPPALLYADLTHEPSLQTWFDKIIQETEKDNQIHVLTLVRKNNSRMFHDYILSKSKEINFIFPAPLLLLLWQGKNKGMPIIRSVKEEDIQINKGWTRDGHLRKRTIEYF